MTGTRKDQIEVSSMLTNPDMAKIHLALKAQVKPKEIYIATETGVELDKSSKG